MTRRPLIWTEEVFEVFHYSVDAFQVNFAEDIFVTAGRPYVAGQNWHVIVDEGVSIGGLSTAVAAATTGIFPRILQLTVLGSIIGAGGSGGAGGIESGTKDGGKGGGGGGGAGIPVGAGGIASSLALDGAPGTLLLGGAGGAGSIDPSGFPEVPGLEGMRGGEAVELNMPIRLVVSASGGIFGGGGGGGGAHGQGVQLGTAKRCGGYGGNLGANGKQGGDGVTECYVDGGAGGGYGQSGWAFLNEIAYPITKLSVANGRVRGGPYWP